MIGESAKSISARPLDNARLASFWPGKIKSLIGIGGALVGFLVVHQIRLPAPFCFIACASADGEGLEFSAIQANVKLMRLGQTDNIEHAVALQANGDLILRIEREVVGDSDSAPRAKGDVFALSQIALSATHLARGWRSPTAPQHAPV